MYNTKMRHGRSCECGCNIGDSRLIILGEEFTFIMLLSGGWNVIDQLKFTLLPKGAELNLLIVMKLTTAQEQPANPPIEWVMVGLDDSPYLT